MAAPQFVVRPASATLRYTRGLPVVLRFRFVKDAEGEEPWNLSGHSFAGGLAVGGEVVEPFDVDVVDPEGGVVEAALTGGQTDRPTDCQWLFNDGDVPIFDGPAIPGEPGKAGVEVAGGSSLVDVTVRLSPEVLVVVTPLPRDPVSNGTTDHALLSNRDAADQHPIEAITGLSAALLGKADLVGGVIPTAQIPAVAVVEFMEAADEAAMLALDAQRNDVALRLDESLAYILMGDDPTELSDWVAWPMPGAAVVSVNGQTGVIVLSAADVGAVPTSRTVNGKALSANVTLAASDVGAAPATRPIGTGLATSGTVDLDMAALNGTTQWITATGALTFTTSNRAAGRSVSLVVDAGASDRSLTWPGWLASGGGLPDEVEAGTRLHVSVVFLDSTDGAASAGWAVFE